MQGPEFRLYDAWAETTTVESDAPETYMGARAGDPCCEPQCDHHLRAGETVYAVTQLNREHANPGRRETWVCWRHVRPD